MKNIFKWGLGFLLITSIITVFFQMKSNATTPYNTKVYAVNKGYGYEISLNNKILIKQDNIPAISEQHTFCTLEDAMKIADLVVTKLKNKQNPRITKEELKTNAITLNCIN